MGLLQGWLDIGAIGHFIAVVLHLGWTYIVELLFVNFSFYFFNLPAGRQVSSGSGRTSNEFQPCSKPCPLAASWKHSAYKKKRKNY
ncbi:hypothetical protein [Ferruginibacter profundus]